MLEAARDATELVDGLSLHGFEQTKSVQWAVAYRLIVVGEAANRTSDTFQDLYPEVPWHDIRGMRNFVVHEYDYVRWDVVWKTLNESLPPLIEHLDKILRERQ